MGPQFRADVMGSRELQNVLRKMVILGQNRHFVSAL